MQYAYAWATGLVRDVWKCIPSRILDVIVGDPVNGPEIVIAENTEKACGKARQHVIDAPMGTLSK